MDFIFRCQCIWLDSRIFLIFGISRFDQTGGCGTFEGNFAYKSILVTIWVKITNEITVLQFSDGYHGFLECLHMSFACGIPANNSSQHRFYCTCHVKLLSDYLKLIPSFDKLHNLHLFAINTIHLPIFL